MTRCFKRQLPSVYALSLACCSAAGQAAATPSIIFGAGPDTSGGTNTNYPGPQVQVTNIATPGGTFASLGNFFAYSPGFAGGVRVAAGDVNGDGTPDIITAPGPGSLGVGQPGPQVHAFDGITHNPISGFSFHPFGQGFTGGATVAAGDFTGDGIADIVTGTDLFGSPQFRVFNGADQSLLGTFSNLTGLGFVGEVNVTAADYTGDGVTDIIASAGGNVALMQTTFNPSGDPAWNTFDPPTFAPFGDGYTGFIDTTLLDIDLIPGGATSPVLMASGPNGLLAFDITDPNDPRNVFTNFLPGDLTGTGLTSGDYDGDGRDDLGVYRGDGTWWVTGPNNNDFIGFAPGGTITPFGGQGGSIVSGAMPDALSRAFTVAPGQVSTGLGDAAPGASEKVDLFGDIQLEVFATDNAAVGVEFDAHSLNLSAADINIPDGVAFLRNTRGIFVETDAPDGTYEARLDFSFEPDRLAELLALHGASIEDIRLAHLIENPDGSFDIDVNGNAALIREFNNTVGDFTLQEDEFGSIISGGVVEFSGYALVVIPEPSSCSLLGLGLLALVRRRRG